MDFGSRSHRRLIGCLLALTMALCALYLAPTAGAHNGQRAQARSGQHAWGGGGQRSYLALGDSLAFGYSQAKFNSLFPNENPAAYNTGYVDDFGKVLRLFNPGLQVVNDGCPGETTDSFINGP